MKDLQQEDGNQCCPKLDFECIGRGPHKCLDLQVLLDGLEENLNLPAFLVNGGNGGGSKAKVICEQRQFAVGSPHPRPRRLGRGGLRPVSLCWM